MKLTYRQINRLKAALTALGASYTKIIKENNRDVAVSVPYRFGKESKAVRSAAAFNLRLLGPHAETYTDLRNQILLELTAPDEQHPDRVAGVIGDEDHALESAFAIKLRELDKSEVPEDLALRPITEAQLDLETNPIPPDVIAELALLEAPAKAAAAAEPPESDA